MFAAELFAEIETLIEDYKKNPDVSALPQIFTLIQQIKQDSQNSETLAAIYERLGHIHYENKQYTEAICQYTLAIDHGSQTADCWANRGNIYFSENAFSQANSDFNEAIQRGIRTYEIYCSLGQSYTALANLSAAASAYEQALPFAVTRSQQIEISTRLAQSYQLSERHNKAVEIYELLLQQKDLPWVFIPEIHKNLVMTYFSLGRYSFNLRFFKEALREQRTKAYDQAAQNHKLDIVYIDRPARNSQNQSIFYQRAFLKLIKGLPTDNLLEKEFFKQRDQDLSAKKVSSSQEPSSAFDQIIAGLQIMSGKKKSFKEKMQAANKVLAKLKKILAKDPNNLYANELLAEYYYSSEQYEQTIVQCNKTFALSGKSYSLYKFRGFAFFCFGKYKEAIQDFETAILHKVADMETYFSFAGCYEKSAQPIKAFRILQAATEVFPGNVEVINRYNKACAALSSADKANLENSNGLYHAQLGQLAKAKEYFEAAKSLNPKNACVYINLSNCYCLEQNIQKALEILDEGINIVPNKNELTEHKNQMLKTNPPKPTRSKDFSP